MIPTQPLGRDLCAHCHAPIHLTNQTLGPTWVHDVSAWCGAPGTAPTTRAVPAGRAWPEVAS